MKLTLLQLIQQLNPWLDKPTANFLPEIDYIQREFDDALLDSEFDDLCLLLTGPRRAGKTTLGLHIANKLVLEEERFDQLLYLNCDHFAIRDWLQNTLFIKELMDHFHCQRPLVFIDEVQRLENPGLFLKSCVDLALPVKWLATGSSQLDLKSQVQEAVTGRHLSEAVLPLSIREGELRLEERLVFGCYPRITQAKSKERLLTQLYDDYINKDIISILKIAKSDVIQKLLSLVAHSSGQLINYSQLAVDCGVSQPTIKDYLSMLEATFVIRKLTPFVGNKRMELTRNPIYYFLDNGFRNQALGNFLPMEQRVNTGMLVESFCFQELVKWLKQAALPLTIHYWRTKSGAEVDFVLTDALQKKIIPIEIKYRNMVQPNVTRGFRSFIEAHKPKQAFVINKDLVADLEIDGCHVMFVPLAELKTVFDKVK